jgi:hypothetical protein
VFSTATAGIGCRLITVRLVTRLVTAVAVISIAAIVLIAVALLAIGLLVPVIITFNRPVVGRTIVRSIVAIGRFVVPGRSTKVGDFDGEIAISVTAAYLELGFAGAPVGNVLFEFSAACKWSAFVRGDHISFANAGVEGGRAGNDSPDDYAVVVAVVQDNTELLDRLDLFVTVVLSELGRLDPDGFIAAIAVDDDFDPIAVRAEQIVNEVGLASDAMAIHGDDAVSFAETELGDRAMARNVSDDQRVVVRAIEPEADVWAAHVGRLHDGVLAGGRGSAACITLIAASLLIILGLVAALESRGRLLVR